MVSINFSPTHVDLCNAMFFDFDRLTIDEPTASYKSSFCLSFDDCVIFLFCVICFFFSVVFLCVKHFGLDGRQDYVLLHSRNDICLVFAGWNVWFGLWCMYAQYVVRTMCVINRTKVLMSILRHPPFDDDDDDERC